MTAAGSGPVVHAVGATAGRAGANARNAALAAASRASSRPVASARSAARVLSTGRSAAGVLAGLPGQQRIEVPLVVRGTPERWQLAVWHVTVRNAVPEQSVTPLPAT